MDSVYVFVHEKWRKETGELFYSVNCKGLFVTTATIKTTSRKEMKTKKHKEHLKVLYYLDGN